MLRKSPQASGRAEADDASAAVGFPETQTAILQQAADGHWEPFLRKYLAPCWREVVIRCRQQNIPLVDADDLYQELLVRIVRVGRFAALGKTAADGPGPEFRANIPARYLRYRELTLHSAKFRTVLKAVIRNLILEALRDRARQPRSLDFDVADAGPRLEDSIADTVERQWMIECLEQAARQLQRESREARTKGARRLFDVLYRSAVRNESPGLMATEFAVDRTTVSSLVTRARARFVELLQAASGVEDTRELMEIVSRIPECLASVLEQVRGEAGGLPGPGGPG